MCTDKLGLEEALRWFYLTIGCLDEPGAHEASRISFRSSQIELRIDLTENPLIESAGFPVILAVPSLELAIEQLAEKSWSFKRLTGTTLADARVATLDPAGNRVELRREWALGLI
jgi:hypothetical protein